MSGFDDDLYFVRYSRPFVDPRVSWQDAKPIAQCLADAGAAYREARYYSRACVFEARQAKQDWMESKSGSIKETRLLATDAHRYLKRFEGEFGTYRANNQLAAASVRALSYLRGKEDGSGRVSHFLGETIEDEMRSLLQSIRRMRQALSVVERSHQLGRGSLGDEVTAKLLDELATMYRAATGQAPTITTDNHGSSGGPRIAGRFAAYVRASAASAGAEDMLSDHHIKSAVARWRKGGK